MKKPYIADGIDQQGRNSDLACAAGIVQWVIVALAIWAIVLLTFTFVGSM